MSDGPKYHEDDQQQEERSVGNPMDRRQFLKAAGLAGAAIGVGSAFGGLVPEADAKKRRRRNRPPNVNGDCVAILGLGAGPIYYPDRNNTGFALFHNGYAYLIDAGAGTTNEFMKLGVTLDKVKGLFFTHYHIDHTTSYADLLSRGSQANGPNNNLKMLNVYGPTHPIVGAVEGVGGVNGLDALTQGTVGAFGPGYDLHFWARPYLDVPPFVPAPRPTVTTSKIAPNSPDALAAIPVLTGDPDMRVEAIEVDHDEYFGTCYAYRFTLLDGGGKETGKSIVFSGDRAHYNARRDPGSVYFTDGPGIPYFPADDPTNEDFQAAFNSFAMGATVLVHEAAKNESATLIADPNSPIPFVRALYWHLIDSHTDVSQVPQIAKEAKVGAVVLNHYGDYTTKGLEAARGIILSGVMKANAKVHYRGEIIAPLEGDVVHF